MASNICVCFLPYLAVMCILEAAGEKEEGIQIGRSSIKVDYEWLLRSTQTDWAIINYLFAPNYTAWNW